MKDKIEQIFDKHHEGYAVYNKDEIIKELLVLFNVVGRSEELKAFLDYVDGRYSEQGTRDKIVDEFLSL